MIIENIQLQHLGPFASKVSVDTSASGINVLAAPNEQGKSTLIRAAFRCLFDKHTCKDGEIKRMQPLGTDLSPYAQVDFQVDGKQFRIAKKFLNSPTSQLFEKQDDQWKLVADADQADKRVVELLESTQALKGATKPAHWGMMRYLWGRQGEPMNWLDWDGDMGQQIRSRLAKVEIDPVVEQLTDSLMEEYSTNFTDGGKPRKNGVLHSAQQKLEEVVQSLAEVRGKLLALEQKETEFQSMDEMIRQLEAEREESEATAIEVRKRAQKADEVIVSVRALEAEKSSAEERLAMVSNDEAAQKQIGKSLQELRADKESITNAGISLQQSLSRTATELKGRQDQLDVIRKKQREGRDSLDRLTKTIELRKKREDLEKLRKQLAKVVGIESELRDLNADLVKLPSLTPAKLKSIEALEKSLSRKQIQIEAIGLSIELQAEQSGVIEFSDDRSEKNIELDAGETVNVNAAQRAKLTLPGWGKIKIRSGASEVGDLLSELESEREELKEALDALSVATVAEARDTLERRKELSKQVKTVEKSLQDQLEDWDSRADLEAAIAGSEARCAALTGQLEPTEEELSESLADMEAREEAQRVTLEAAEAETDEAEEEAKCAQQTLDQAKDAVAEHEKKAVENTGKINSEERRLADIKNRYTEGIENALSQAKSEFVKAEARHSEKLKELPEDHEQLPERSKRAAGALAAIDADLKKKQSDYHRLEGELKSQGASGLYSQETELLESQAQLQAEAENARKRGWSARLVRDLIEHRKDEATRSVLRPLEDRLSQQFAAITKEHGRRVFLDENLEIAGIGQEDAHMPFDSLSQGAREQLLLSLRLAVALELAEDGPQCLILDDVLVNSDRARQERIMDVLQSASEKIQVFILTCHPDWYRGFGQPIELEVGE